MKPSPDIERLFGKAGQRAAAMRHDILTPEHFLRTLIDDPQFREAVLFVDIDLEALADYLDNFLATLDTVDDIPPYEPVEGVSDDDKDGSIDLSYMLMRAYSYADAHAESSGSDCITLPLLFRAILGLGPDSPAVIALQAYADCSALMEALVDYYGSGRTDTDDDDDDTLRYDDDALRYDDDDGKNTDRAPWRSLVTCITRQLRERPDSRGPFIGREAELERTIQVLCRCDKNNPLHVGEPGVGKTALVYGLARRINEGRVPERLKGCEIYLLDLGSLLADTQYRGDFEKRIKLVMEGVANETADDPSQRGKGIVYIDEIHNLIGAGRTGEGSFDAANMLKPYLESGTIRFIGSTTYGEFNRHFAKSPGIVRRFQKIDIAEPSVEDTVQILEGLRERYETFHGVVYEPGVFEHRPYRQLVHGRGVLRPDREIVRIGRELFLQFPHDGRILVVEHRAVSRCETAVDLLLRGDERLCGNDGLQGPFHDLPERFVLFVQQEHQPRRLRVEGRRDVSYRKMNDFLDLCVVDRGFGGQFIITAPVLQRVFQISLHSRWHVIVCPFAKIAQLLEKCADYNVK